MYEAEFGLGTPFHLEDVWATDRVLDSIVDTPFLATASLPCTDLSLAGHCRGLGGQHSSTYFGFVEVLKRLGNQRPKVVMLENVVGFLTSHQGDDFATAVTVMSELGYWIDAFVLDAKWFVPQSRPRTFVFGYHESLVSPLLHRRPVGFNFDQAWNQSIQRTAILRPQPLLTLYDRIDLPTGWVTLDFALPTPQTYDLKDFIDLDDEQAWWDPSTTLHHLDTMESPSRRRVEEAMAGQQTMIGTAFRRTRRGKTRCEVRFDMAGCLRTPKGGSAKQIVVVIELGRVRMRWMNGREYARLQGAADYAITVPPTQAMYGFGDAVCVPAIEWIDQNILTPIYQDHLHSKSEFKSRDHFRTTVPN